MKKILLALGIIAIAGFAACGGGGSDDPTGVAVTGVSLNKTNTAILAGGTEQLTATITPSNATNQNVTWTSSNGSAVTVSTGGLVSRTVYGTATITVTTADGNFTASCNVTLPIQLVSVDSSGAQGNNDSYEPMLSEDGRYVAFSSRAANMVPGDTNGICDVFVHDRQTKTTERVSVDSNGVQGDSDSYAPSISADGRYVAFYSYATNLVSGDTNGTFDIFVYDRQTKTTERVSVDSAGVQGNGSSEAHSISADGRYVAFSSDASNLVTGDTNGTTDVFVYDRQTDAIRRVSVNATGTEGNGSSVFPSISADGRYVAFYSFARNLVTPHTGSYYDIFVYDLQTNDIKLVSVNSTGVQGNDHSSKPSISADGRYVTFSSSASNLVTGDSNSKEDIFVYDRQTNAIQRVSVNSTGAQGNDDSNMASISADGRYVAFRSGASNLVPGDTGAFYDIFVYDRQTNAIKRVNVDPSGAEGNMGGFDPCISADGQYVVFYSSSTNFVPDTNGFADIFVAPVQ
jgi:Tol biopolymer transport system component